MHASIQLLLNLLGSACLDRFHFNPLAQQNTPSPYEETISANCNEPYYSVSLLFNSPLSDCMFNVMLYKTEAPL